MGGGGDTKKKGRGSIGAIGPPPRQWQMCYPIRFERFVKFGGFFIRGGAGGAGYGSTLAACCYGVRLGETSRFSCCIW